MKIINIDANASCIIGMVQQGVLKNDDVVYSTVNNCIYHIVDNEETTKLEIINKPIEQKD
jgi:hypothetical protein